VVITTTVTVDMVAMGTVMEEDMGSIMSATTIVHIMTAITRRNIVTGVIMATAIMIRKWFMYTITLL
jgi:hypothetical protein